MAHIGINIGLTANARAWDAGYDAVATDADIAAQWNARVARIAALIAEEIGEDISPVLTPVPAPRLRPADYEYAADGGRRITGYEREPDPRAERATRAGIGVGA